MITKSGAAAYRTDLAGLEDGFGPRDVCWIAVTSLLEHASFVRGTHRRKTLRHAVEMSAECLGEARVRARADREWQDRDRSASDVIILLSDDAYRSGALNLASAMLDSLLLADEALTSVQVGRVLARRARIVGKLGRLDEAADQYDHVVRLGRRTKSAELTARAWIGLGALAQMRGDYSEVRDFADRAASLAEKHGLMDLARAAHNGLMIAAGAQHRFDDALVHGWAAYRASLGDTVDEAEVLQNIGQLFLEGGHFVEAKAAFSAVVSRELPVGIVLPALGGLAVSGAITGSASDVTWASDEVGRLANTSAPRYAVASALLECAVGLEKIGKHAEAERLRRDALRRGDVHKFHEIIMRADAMAAALADAIARGRSANGVATRIVLGEQATKIAREVAWMEPKRLPEHVQLVAASA